MRRIDRYLPFFIIKDLTSFNELVSKFTKEKAS